MLGSVGMMCWFNPSKCVHYLSVLEERVADTLMENTLKQCVYERERSVWEIHACVHWKEQCCAVISTFTGLETKLFCVFKMFLPFWVFCKTYVFKLLLERCSDLHQILHILCVQSTNFSKLCTYGENAVVSWISDAWGTNILIILINNH